MDPEPVKRINTPRYPTRREVLAGAASFVLVGLTGRGFVFAQPADGSGEGKPIVAPIFEHGEGRGSTGCMVSTPPVFLSEEEGMQIVREELAKHGIQLQPGGILEGVRIPARIQKMETVDQGDAQTNRKISVVEDPNRAVPLKLDGVDPDGNVAVEFVSQEDYFDLGGARSATSVTGYDFKDVAEYVVAAAKEQGTGHMFLGVFYDPVVRDLPPAPRDKAATPKESVPSEDNITIDRQSTSEIPREPRTTSRGGAVSRGGTVRTTTSPATQRSTTREVSPERLQLDSDALLQSWKKRRERYVQESGKLLRQQAQDFAAWLKEQKAIP